MGSRVFRKATDSKVWHLCNNCSNWPSEEYEISYSEPIGEEHCEECKAKRKDGSCKSGTVA